MKNSNWWLYVLKLEQGKYYVGITSKTPEIRMQEHIKHRHGAYWTMMYKPLEIIYKQELGEMTKEEAEVYENRKTREMIQEFGVNEVRGGDIRMTEEIIRRFGYYFKLNDWKDLVYVILLYAWGMSWMILYFTK